MTMASSKNKLTEQKLHEGVMTSILGAILKGRISTVTKALKGDPELQKLAKNVDKAVDKLDKQLEKQRKMQAKAGNRMAQATDDPFTKGQSDWDKKMKGKYF